MFPFEEVPYSSIGRQTDTLRAAHQNGFAALRAVGALFAGGTRSGNASYIGYMRHWNSSYCKCTTLKYSSREYFLSKRYRTLRLADRRTHRVRPIRTGLPHSAPRALSSPVAPGRLGVMLEASAPLPPQWRDTKPE